MRKERVHPRFKVSCFCSFGSGWCFVREITSTHYGWALPARYPLMFLSAWCFVSAVVGLGAQPYVSQLAGTAEACLLVSVPRYSGSTVAWYGDFRSWGGWWLAAISPDPYSTGSPKMNRTTSHLCELKESGTVRLWRFDTTVQWHPIDQAYDSGGLWFFIDA